MFGLLIYSSHPTRRRPKFALGDWKCRYECGWPRQTSHDALLIEEQDMLLDDDPEEATDDDDTSALLDDDATALEAAVLLEANNPQLTKSAK